MAQDVALAEYKEVVTQFRTLTDIRFKLLAFLPLGTVAAAVFVPATNDLEKQPAIAAFALVVTLCIAAYNKRNDQFYDELVSRAAELERELQIEHGSFANRPKPWLKYGSFKIEHRWPIGLIYAASASLWMYLLTAALVDKHPRLIWLRLITWAVVIACWLVMRRMERGHSKKQRKAVQSLMEKLNLESASQGTLVEAIVAAKPILGVDSDTAKRRVAFHWQAYQQKPDSRGASTLLSAVIDLPARWIEDVSTGRR